MIEETGGGRAAPPLAATPAAQLRLPVGFVFEARASHIIAPPSEVPGGEPAVLSAPSGAGLRLLDGREEIAAMQAQQMARTLRRRADAGGVLLGGMRSSQAGPLRAPRPMSPYSRSLEADIIGSEVPPTQIRAKGGDVGAHGGEEAARPGAADAASTNGQRPTEDPPATLIKFASVGKAGRERVRESRAHDDDSILRVTKRLLGTAREHLPGASDELVRVAAAAIPCRFCRLVDIGLRGHCMLLHLFIGDILIRARDGVLRVYQDGAWQAYNGVIAESVLARCRSYLIYLEGIFLLLEKLPRAASDEVFLQRLHQLWQRSGLESDKFLSACQARVALGPAAGVADAESGDGAAPGADDPGDGAAEPAPAAAGAGDLDADAGGLAPAAAGAGGPDGGDGEPAPAIAPPPGAPRQPQGVFVAKAAQEISAALQQELLARKLITYYSEWCNLPRLARAGVAFQDSRCLFAENGPLEFVDKALGNNVYVYIPHNLKYPVLQSAETRLHKFLSQTFWGNSLALECQLAATALTLQRHNIDRCFWTVGPGGVGQSILAHLIHNVFRGRHAFWGTNIHFSDDELRKQADGLIGKLITTVQEAVDNSKHGFREDLFKKHISADPIARVCLYGIATRLIEVPGWKRLELHRLIQFTSILSKFKTEAEVNAIPDAASRRILVKDPRLRAFVKSQVVAPASWELLRGFMESHSRAGSEDIIEQCATGGDGGLTRDCVQAATGLSAEKAAAAAAAEFDPAQAATNADRALSVRTFRCKELAEYVRSGARTHNVETVIRYLGGEGAERKKKRGRIGKKTADDVEKRSRMLESLRVRETDADTVARHIGASTGAEQGGDAPETTQFPTTYQIKCDVLSRRYVSGFGAQCLNWSARLAGLGNVDDWDIKKCAFTLAPQIAARVEFALGQHQAAKLESVRRCTTDAASVCEELGLNADDTKDTCMSIFCGGNLPDDLAENGFLVALRREGIYLRWLAVSLDREMHKTFIEDVSRRSPAATTWFYTWTFPGRVGDRAVFKADSERAILEVTEYSVEVALKTHACFLEMLVGDAETVGQDDAAIPPVLLKAGNCIILMMARLTDDVGAVATIASRRNKVNKDAAESQVRTYGSCSKLMKQFLAPSLDSPTGVGKYLIHVENGDHPQCVAGTLLEHDVCHLFVGEKTYATKISTVRRCWSACADSKYLAQFKMSAVELPPDSPERMILDLAAGGSAGESAGGGGAPYTKGKGLRQDISDEFETHLEFCVCGCKLCKKGDATHEAIVHDLRDAKTVTVTPRQCNSKKCKLTYGPNFAWVGGRKKNAASLADLEGAGVAFISSKRGFTLRYARYYEATLSKNFASPRGSDWAQKDLFDDGDGSGWQGGEFPFDLRKLHNHAILHVLAAQELGPLDKHLDVYVEEDIGESALRAGDDHLHQRVYPPANPACVAELGRVLKKPSAARKFAVKATMKRPAAAKTRAKPKPVAKRAAAIRKPAATMAGAKRKVPRSLHRNIGWFTLLTTSGRAVAVTEQAAPESNDIVKSTILGVLPQYPKVNCFICDGACPVMPSAMLDKQFDHVKYWIVDKLRAQKHAAFCACNPLHIHRLKLRVSGVNTQVTEQCFSWFRGYSRIFNEMSPSRRRFLVLYFVAKNNSMLSAGDADHLGHLAAIFSNMHRKPSGHYPCA
ncbi:unnamed protein product [Prorocentrum cordatum]|uniref:Uncharacterized protein n=1 Tax=Prorocentrum cordatum TaxID=2364126 RepID=A0ABN9W1V8_9DINO|nr:unnamed protein product [Polarella glacialis]